MRDIAAHFYSSLKEGTVEIIPPNTVHSAIQKAKAWYTSAGRFVQHMTKDYPLYCDLLAPFVTGISQVGKSLQVSFGFLPLKWKKRGMEEYS